MEYFLVFVALSRASRNVASEHLCVFASMVAALQRTAKHARTIVYPWARPVPPDG